MAQSFLTNTLLLYDGAYATCMVWFYTDLDFG